MKRIIRSVSAVCATVVLAANVAGCSNSSGSLGKGKLSILDLVSIEGEGISWDNRVQPQPASEIPKGE